MINSSEFTKRLQKVIDYYGESSSSFAEKIGVQRSSISHILSGRNKPSLDFVLKILSSFPEVELYWLLNGKGSFPKEDAKPVTNDLFSTPTDITENTNQPESVTSDNLPNNVLGNNNGKTIERIVIFYTDGSFKNFENSI